MHTLGIIVFVSCVLSVVAQLDPRWKLVWSDEFTGDSVNLANWNVVDSPGLSGNGEKEWYMPSQVYVENGTLVLRSDNISYVTSYPYRSGEINSNGRFSATYGRWEVHAKLPEGKGMWPAHWLLSEYNCWPVGTEFDIMEALGNNINNIYGTVHFSTGQCYAGIANGTVYKAPFNYSTDYHTYAIEWNETSVKWFVDEVQYYEVLTSSVNHGKPLELDNSPHYWILNTAVGGYWPGDPDETTVFPQFHYIDYVRMYGWEPCVTGCNNGCCYEPLQICVCDENYQGTNCEYIAKGKTPGEMANCTQPPPQPTPPPPTPAPTPPPCVVPKVPSFVRDFNTPYNTSVDNFEKSSQGPTQELPSNLAISNGQLILSLTTQGCPAACNGANYSGAAYSSVESFADGIFVYNLKSTNVSGSAFLFWGTGVTNNIWNAYQFTLAGNAPTKVAFQYWAPEGNFYVGDFELGFDASQDFHTYTLEYHQDQISSFYADGNLICTIAPGPIGNLNMKLEYFAQPQYYGKYTDPNPSYGYASSISWKTYCGTSNNTKPSTIIVY